MEHNKSIKVNMVLNALKGAMSILFPLITFPYISKILGVTNVGRYNFASSIISYFLLLAGLGITTYAIREGSKFRDDRINLDFFSTEIFSINVLSTVISYILLFGLLFASSKLYSYKDLILILSIQIAFQTIGVEWIYSIHEDYLYITVRSFIFQLLSLALMFLLVRSPQDVGIYAGITVFSSVGSNILNFVHARRYSHIKLTRQLNLRNHIKPIMILFAMSLTVTIYVSSDITILGLLKDDNAVGIYSTSVKIYTVVKRLLSSILVVSIPRLSMQWGTNQIDNFNHTARDIYSTLITILLPAIIGIILLRNEIILIIADKSYLDANISLALLGIALFFCMGAWFWGQCILVPAKKESIVFKATIISAIINVALNFVLIPIWSSNAAAVTTIIAEAFAFFLCRSYGKQISRINNITSIVGKTLVGCVAIVLEFCFVRSLKLGTITTFLLVTIIGVIVYFSCQILMKNEAIYPLIERIKCKIHKQK